MTIAGANTTLNGPEGICLDLRGRLFVTNALGNSITIFNAGASGNVRPTDTIVGASTGLNTPMGIAIDPVGRLYVANSGAGASTSSITVYASGAKGNAAPIDTIAGTNTALDQPQGLALDPAGRIYVANSAFTSHQYRITVYGGGANGNVVPAVTLAGNKTGLSVPSHLSF
jgi:streptogramin lyase